MTRPVTLGRRSVVAGLGAGALAVGAGAAVSAPDLRVRREISDLEKWYPAELDRYRRGVAEMRRSAAGDTAWERNATIHAARCGIGAADIHGSWFFLPWHRAFLWVTELNLQHALGDDKLALPYWHWPVLGAIPASFRTGPLEHPRGRLELDPVEYDLTAGMAPDRFVGEYTLQAGRPVVSRLGFGGYADTRVVSTELEKQPHGSVHNGVGNRVSDMSNIKWSPRDPVFFGHHGNLDRLWEVWRGQPSSAQRNSEPWADRTFGDVTYDFFDLRTGAVRTIRMAEMRETASLGYRYALPGEGPSGPPSTPVDSGRPAAGPVAPDPSRLGAPVARGQATVDAPPLAVSGGPPVRTRAVLTVQDVQVPPGVGVTVAIYLTDRAKPNFNPAEAVFVGVAGFVSQPTENRISLALDVTNALPRTRIDRGRVGVVLVPLGQKDAPPLRVGGYRIKVSSE